MICWMREKNIGLDAMIIIIKDITPITIPKTLRGVSFSWKHTAATIAAIMVLPPFIKPNKIAGGTSVVDNVASWLMINTATDERAPNTKSFFESLYWTFCSPFAGMQAKIKSKTPTTPKDKKENTDTSPSGT